MSKKLYTGEFAGMCVVSANPNLSPQEVSLLTAFAEAKREERRRHTFTIKVTPCTCNDQKYMDIPHAHVVVSEGAEAYPFGPVFSRSSGALLLKTLEEKGFMNVAQVQAATAALAKLIKAEHFTWPSRPELEERFIQAHIADDAVRALCSPQK